MAELDSENEKIDEIVAVDGVEVRVATVVPEQSSTGTDLLPLLTAVVVDLGGRTKLTKLFWDSVGQGAIYEVYRNSEADPFRTTGGTYVMEPSPQAGWNEYFVDATVATNNYLFADAEDGWQEHPVEVEVDEQESATDIGPEPEPSEDTGDGYGDTMNIVMSAKVWVGDGDPPPDTQTPQGGMISNSSAVSTTLRHITFIAPAKVSAGDTFACLRSGYGRRFGGDNRGYGATASTYRTRAHVNIYWLSHKMFLSRYVRDTILYRSDGTVQSRKNAGTGNIYATRYGAVGSSVRFEVYHSKGNPYCANSGGQIKYKWSAAIYRDGWYSIGGWHRKAPHHEIYIKRNGFPWNTIHRRANSGFNCLVISVCSTASISRTGHAGTV